MYVSVVLPLIVIVALVHAAKVNVITVDTGATDKPVFFGDALVESQLLRDSAYFFASVNESVEDVLPMQLCANFTLEEATIDEMQTVMSNGSMTAVDFTLCFLERIFQTDEYVRAVMQLNPDALSIARALDQERAAGHVRGPLHGIPFLVKDNIATRDKMQTTAGSWALMGSRVPRDAHVVTRLRGEGAVLLGHAAMSEWADMRSSNYSEGYSSRGGQCRSAYNLTVSPGGSSSGSAVAIAANLAAFAIGTETDGSVINPAQRNGLVGVKPTVGLTSRDMVIPESLHQDTVGCFARTVRDAAYCLDGIYGVDTRDNYTLSQLNNSDVPSREGYASFMTGKDALKGAVFGIPWDSFWRFTEPDMLRQLLDLVTLIEEAGATIVNGTEIPSRGDIISPDGWDWDYGSKRGRANESEFTYVKVDFYNDLKQYLSELGNTDMHSLEDIVKYNLANPTATGAHPGDHPAFASGQDLLLAALATNGTQDEDYWQALSFCTNASRTHGIDAALSSHRLANGTSVSIDALLAPADVAQAAQVAAMAGYPVVTVPVGVRAGSGMPFGISVMGTAWQDARLLALASAVEDLQIAPESERRGGGRVRPGWGGFKERALPVF
ncbi:uncharacterized protein K452DRAFT_302761 [Aplosporella prunicola CBS 121167]|uniref:Amidase domain-containing protein n=1 Tax=Aplosporella prunicola CBS 121167 TaxID=1176127 RepID=A0A6A6AXG0_9PEZI|nr:uncharacterized protein K452DRAFT_302761 [Aplosporella prunicola CBS 121167]KAF2136430.1 hypothetical protein K452DRAFT_302761 [Aplosporella prunicola CBS 121167]